MCMPQLFSYSLLISGYSVLLSESAVSCGFWFWLWVLCPVWGAGGGYPVVKPTGQPSGGRQLQPDHLYLPHAVWRRALRNNDLVHRSRVPWWVLDTVFDCAVFLPLNCQINDVEWNSAEFFHLLLWTGLKTKLFTLFQVSTGSPGLGISLSLGRTGAERKRTRVSPHLCQRRAMLKVQIIIITIYLSLREEF